MSSLHLIEGWWDGVRGLAATDAAAAACADGMAPGDAAVVLGPRAAAKRVAALGVRVAGAWSSPLGMHGLWTRPLKRLAAGLAAGGGAFERVVAWTPGAVGAAAKLGLPLDDQSSGDRWPSPAAAAPRAREPSRVPVPGVHPGTLVIGVVWDPADTADALTAIYGLGIIEKARLFRGRPAVMLVPPGASGLNRAHRMAVGVRQSTFTVEAPGPIPALIAASDALVIPPLDRARGHHARPNLRAARAWWVAAAAASGLPVILGPDDPEAPNAVRMTAWGRAELGRALREALIRMHPEPATV